MNADSIPIDGDPANIVADFERRARRFETSCGDGALVWRAWGSGPPVLLAHGAQGAWSHWIRNIDALAQTRTVWAVDLPGFGESALPPREDHESVAEVIAAGMRELIGPDRAADVVGFSFGGVAAAYLSGFHPERVRRLVLIGTGGLDTPVGEVYLRRVRGLEGEERHAALRANLLAIMLHHSSSTDDLAVYLHGLNGSRGRLNGRSFVLPAKLLDILPRISVQMDVLWGEFDLPHPNPAVQEAVFRKFQPDINFHVISGAGHWAMYEGGDAFNRALLEILQQPLRSAR